MMKFLGGCLVFVLLLAALAFYWTTTWPEEVRRSIEIEAPAAAVFETVATPKTWPEWTAWTQERDPEAVWTFEGPDSGTGASWEWRGLPLSEDGLGHGKLTLLETAPAERIEYGLVFWEDETEWASTGAFLFEEHAGVTTVHWTMEPSGVEGLARGFTNFMMDMSVGPDFETGLSQLKQRLETDARSPAETPAEPAETPAAND
ncbi:MAG: SRPBCC family protein [Planctomycetota bacterium]